MVGVGEGGDQSAGGGGNRPPANFQGRRVNSMARMRTIKPGFFQNDQLAELPPLARLLFIGLWTEADREGRLEDRPKRFKAVLLPYDDCAAEDVDAWLHYLDRDGFIYRYEVGRQRYIQIVNFSKHQNPHVKESPSAIPPPESGVNPSPPTGSDDDDDDTVLAEGQPCASTVLIPDGQDAGPGTAQYNPGSYSNSNSINITARARAKDPGPSANLPVPKPPLPNPDYSAEARLLAECCDLSPRTMGFKSLAALDAALAELRAIRFEFALLPEFRKWWNAEDWRGKKGQSPTVMQVRDEWAKFKKWREARATVLQMGTKKQYCGKCDHGYIPSGVTGGRALRCECVSRPRMEATA